ncbi:MAG: RIP metalloprotease RseP [Clostridia bacterium]|nr:RIP metalloprotease RseP [Clostridia bacterium]
MKLNLLLTFPEVWAKVWPILVAILFFGFIIFIHEFGHFIFAKIFGVKVNEFALGMGPTILKKQGKETKYALRLFPIGGFVSMEGEEEESDDDGAFCNKKVWQRMIITAAGAVNNIILGVLICILIVAGVGTNQKNPLVGTTTVASFYENATSNAEGGLKTGDKILEIDGKHVFSDYDISFLMQRNHTGKYSFVVERDGKKLELPEVNFAIRTGGNFSYDENCVISSVSSKLKKAGLKDGDKVIAVNGVKVKSNTALMEEIGKDTDYTIDFTILRDGEEKTVEKVTMATVTAFDFSILGVNRTFSNVVGGAFRYTATMSRMVYLSLFDMLTGKYGINDLAGPIGTVSVIADFAEQSAQTMDWSSMFLIMALITINIGLFNLLPIPALDGGRLFFMFVELIFRKKVPPKYENWIHAAGLILLLVFMAVISASDLWKWISGVGFM